MTISPRLNTNKAHKLRRKPRFSYLLVLFSILRLKLFLVFVLIFSQDLRLTVRINCSHKKEFIASSFDICPSIFSPSIILFLTPPPHIKASKRAVLFCKKLVFFQEYYSKQYYENSLNFWETFANIYPELFFESSSVFVQEKLKIHQNLCVFFFRILIVLVSSVEQFYSWKKYAWKNSFLIEQLPIDALSYFPPPSCIL